MREQTLFAQVKEQEVRGEIFMVTHRILQIPRFVYEKVLKGQKEPFSESGAQAFVEAFLKWQGDNEGVMGMVRIDEKEQEIILDVPSVIALILERRLA